MKKIYLLFILVVLSLTNSSGQEYIFEYDVDISQETSKNRRYTLDGEFTTVTGYKMKIDGFYRKEVRGYQRLQGEVRYPANHGAINSIFIWTKYDRKKVFWSNVCKDNGNLYERNDDLNCFSLERPGFRCFERFSDVTVHKFEHYPLLNITKIQNLISKDKSLEINATAGFPTSVYKWKYSTTVPYNWQDVPVSCYTNDVFNANAEQLLGNKFPEMIGQNIFFMIDLGCDKKSNILDVSVKMSAPHITSVLPTNPKCIGESNGAITISIDRAAYQDEKIEIYAKKENETVWDKQDISFLDSKTIQLPNLAEGKYDIKITSIYKGHGTEDTEPSHQWNNIILNDPSEISFSLQNKTDVSCYGGNTGSFIVAASGGAGDYKLMWKHEDDSDFKAATTLEIIGLTAGFYEYYVMDKFGCVLRDNSGSEVIQSIEIKQPTQALSSDFLVDKTKEPSGFGLSNGYTTIQVKGGTADASSKYTVVWNNKSTGVVLNSVQNTVVDGDFESKLDNIPSGTYTVLVTDSKGCQTTREITLNQPAKLLATISQEGQVVCFGDKTVKLSVNAQGGITNISDASYSYEWYKLTGATYNKLSETSNALNSIGAGKYKVKVTDGSSPANTIEVEHVITEPTQITATMATTNITCFDENNGTIRVVAQGGSGVYKLFYKQEKTGAVFQSLSPNIGNNTFLLNNLPNGSYTLYLKDSKSCDGLIGGQQTIQVILTQPEKPLTITSKQIKEPSGFGLSNGSVTIQMEGGTPSTVGDMYSITWKNQGGTIITSQNSKNQDGVFSSKINNLPKGIYTVEIKDKNYAGNQNGCYTTATILVNEPDLLTVSLENTNTVDCYGETTGELIAHVRGGVPYISNRPYTYEWYKLLNGSYSRLTSENDSILSNLPIGKYKVIIKDGSSPLNTVESAVFEIIQPPLLVTNLDTQNISCFEGNDGFVHIAVSGGVGNYKMFYKHKILDTQYKELSINTANNTFYLENLVSGIYSVYIQDGNGCFAKIAGKNIAEIMLSQPVKPLTITSKQVKIPSGFGLDNGYITIEIDGGTPFTTADMYKVVWKNEQGTIIFSQNLRNQNGVFSSKIDNLSKGIYTVEITDKNYVGNQGGCYTTETIYVNEPDLLTISLENTVTVDCYGETTGELIAHAQGGVPYISNLPYTYKWYKIENNASSILTNENDSILSNLPAGKYKVIIEDSGSPLNMVESDIFEITQPSLLITSLDTRNISCFNGNDGFIHISVIGGVGNYKMFYKHKTLDTQYKELVIDNSNNTFYLENLITGTYSIYIQDGNGCFAKIEGKDVAEIRLEQPNEAISIDSSRIVDASGFGDADGEITINIKGGTPNTDGSYIVVWKDSKGVELIAVNSVINGIYKSTIKNLKKDQYSVEIKDANYLIAYPQANQACIVMESYVVNQPPKMAVSIEQTDVISCNGMSDGELIAHGKGGIPYSKGLPYKYKWYKYENEIPKLLVNQSDSILSNISAGRYKVEIEDNSRVPHTTSIEYQLIEPDLLVARGQDVHVTCGETANISIQVSGGTAPYSYEWSTGDITPSISNVYPGNYMVFVKDVRGCETIGTVRVVTPSDLNVAGTVKQPVCYQSANGSINLNVTGGNAPYSYKWSNGSTNQNLSNLKAGFYTVFVTDKGNCTFSQSFKLIEPQPVKLELGEDRVLCKGQSVTLEPKVEDPKTKFKWKSTNGFTSTESKVTLTKAGTYSLTITDSKGCQATDEIKIGLRDYNITSEMVVSTGYIVAKDTIVMVNITHPEPDSVQWLISKKDPIHILESNTEKAVLVFDKEGSYTVGMRSFIGDCYQDIIKTLGVHDIKTSIEDDFDGSSKSKIIVYPNPNNGIFKAEIQLAKIGQARLRLYSMDRGIVVDDRALKGQKDYIVHYEKALSSGTYILLLETESDKQTTKIIIR